MKMLTALIQTVKQLEDQGWEVITVCEGKKSGYYAELIKEGVSLYIESDHEQTLTSVKDLERPICGKTFQNSSTSVDYCHNCGGALTIKKEILDEYNQENVNHSG